MQTIEENLRNAALAFRDAGFDVPRLEAEVLLTNLLKKDKLYLLMHSHLVLSQEEQAIFDQRVNRRLAHEPSAQIVGHREFMGLDFVVTKDVLIPRPDTENIVEAGARLIKKLQQSELSKIKVLDLCCGSGAIGLSLKYEIPEVELILSDVSEKALDVARINAEKFNLKVQFVSSDGFAALGDQSFDLIVTNPPYIPTADIETLASDVKDYEPKLALDGGADGLAFYRRLFHDAPAYLNHGGYLVLECGYDQVAALKKLSAQGFTCEHVIRDLAGRDRGMVLKKAEKIE